TAAGGRYGDMLPDCGPDDPPVCACTGASLANRCEAAARGTNVAYLGVCGAVCTARGDCPAGDVCRKSPERVFTLDGTCGPPPSDCGQVNRICTERRDAEVENECQAMQEDTWVEGPGPCGACLDDGDCYTGDFQGEAMDVCDLPAGNCGQRVLGRCQTIGENDLCEWNIANGDPEPVCGCDGRTYAAACRAAWNGARIDHAGACAPAVP
ncbi:hypothetical protein L6V77_35490, partial [Myxococcota bacterium]|nr:hypothetical protein [Myxococcota bacterium]